MDPSMCMTNMYPDYPFTRYHCIDEVEEEVSSQRWAWSLESLRCHFKQFRSFSCSLGGHIAVVHQKLSISHDSLRLWNADQIQLFTKTVPYP